MADLHHDPIAIVLAAINGYTAQHGGSGSGATTVIVGGTGLLFLPPLWLPLIKWFLAIPHYIVLFVLYVGAFLTAIGAWIAILVTDVYPPFRLAP